MTREEAFRRLAGVRNELEASRFALSHVQRALQAGQNLLGVSAAVKPSHIRDSAANLERTYVLRLFAEYEALLRDYWRTVRPSPRPRRTRMEILMNRVATVCRIPFDALEAAHEVRTYRNQLVHIDLTEQALTFGDCKARLGKFLSFLPVRW